MEYIILLIIILVLAIVIIAPLHPKIEFVSYGMGKWCIRLWYTLYEGHTIHREYKVLWKHGIK